MIVMEFVFWGALLGLVYVYQGYLWLLKGLLLLRGERAEACQATEAGEAPSVTILLTVCNEETKIEHRVRNILECTYPAGKLEILVASDGSTDKTEELVARLGENEPVRLFCSGGRLGKTGTQNLAFAEIHSEIVVFTDADTVFHPEFLTEMIKPFRDRRTGMVSANLLFSKDGNAVSEGQGYYWNYELKLRRYESALGILAVGSGQCMGVRKGLLIPLPVFVGEDCIVPLDVVLQGYRIVHQATAIAYDQMESEPEREFRTRVRMTLRNWVGTWLRPELLNPLRHPGYAFSLWSHKILRWLSPFLLIGCVLSLSVLRASGRYDLPFIMMVFFFLVSVAGWAGERYGRNIPVASHGYSFLLANAGFLIGVTKALYGARIVTYRSGELEKQQERA